MELEALAHDKRTFKVLGGITTRFLMFDCLGSMMYTDQHTSCRYDYTLDLRGILEKPCTDRIMILFPIETPAMPIHEGNATVG
jgi:hypothetical protein